MFDQFEQDEVYEGQYNEQDVVFVGMIGLCVYVYWVDQFYVY